MDGVVQIDNNDTGVIGLDSGCRVRRSGSRNAAMISLTMGRKKIKCQFSAH